jgi:hypothetical protein
VAVVRGVVTGVGQEGRAQVEVRGGWEVGWEVVVVREVAVVGWVGRVKVVGWEVVVVVTVDRGRVVVVEVG